MTSELACGMSDSYGILLMTLAAAAAYGGSNGIRSGRSSCWPHACMLGFACSVWRGGSLGLQHGTQIMVLLMLLGMA